MIVGHTPGGFTDNMARAVGELLSRAPGQPVVFDCKPGADSMIGTEMLVKSAPDGYALTTVIAAHSANPSLYPKMAFDAQADIVPVALTGIVPGTGSAEDAAAFLAREVERNARVVKAARIKLEG
jgi:tripartite-type tricarboxylate transporter receptor subunit TctC